MLLWLKALKISSYDSACMASVEMSQISVAQKVWKDQGKKTWSWTNSFAL